MFHKLKNILKGYDFIRDIYGTYRIIKAWIKYIKNPPYKKFIQNVNKKDHENFTSYFTEVELKRRGKHQTKGINLPSYEKADADGRNWLDFLIKEGLTSRNSVLEYGCGSLRLGKTLISYLDKGEYVGVDISDHFYTLGKDYVGTGLLAQKNPKFYVINSAEYENDLKDKTFDFIYSQWVLMHVHPDELSKYFDNIFKLMGSNSVFYFDYTHSIITLKQNALTWGYPSRKINRLITERGFKFETILGNMLKVYPSKRNANLKLEHNSIRQVS